MFEFDLNFQVQDDRQAAILDLDQSAMNKSEPPVLLGAFCKKRRSNPSSGSGEKDENVKNKDGRLAAILDFQSGNV